MMVQKIENKKMNAMNNENDMKTKQQKPAAMKTTAIIFLLIAFAILAYIGLHDGSSKVVPVKSEAIAVEMPQVDVSKIVDQKQKEYLRKNRQVLADFQAQVKSIGASDFQRARNGIDGTVSELTGFKVTSKLCWKMAKDKFAGTSDTETAISGVIVPKIIQPCMEGNRKIGEAYQAFCLQLQENRNQYYADLVSAADSLKPEQTKLIHDSLNTDYGKMDAQVQQLVMEKAAFTVSLAIEALFFKSTLTCLRSVCGHVVAKLAGSATVAGVSAVADGPLPFGDIVGAVAFVGGAAWSAYDIYKITKVLPGEFRSSLNTTVQNAETTSRVEAAKKAESLVKLCEAESLATVKNFKQELN